MKTQEKLQRSKKRIWQKWSVAVRILPLVIIIGLLKFLAHYYDFEIMELNALFTSLVAGAIFLIGFLLTGVLSDFKESEKLPSELAASIKTLYDDTYTIAKSKKTDTAKHFILFQEQFLSSIMAWLYKKEKTQSILTKISQMNDFFAEFDNEGVQANYVIKMKNEQNSIRKMILRMHTIRDTEFIGSAYAIVEVMGFLIAIGLVIIKIEPFYAALFFTLLVTFLILYMLFLIHDLDNPFDYSTKGETGTEVSIRPLHDLEDEMEELVRNSDHITP